MKKKDETVAERSARLSRPKPTALTADNIGPVLQPFRARLQALEELGSLSENIKALTVRMDTLEHLTNHHLERLDSYTPNLIAQAKQASAKAAVLVERLETAIADQEAWRQRDVARLEAVMSRRSLWGRLTWLVRGA